MSGSFVLRSGVGTQMFTVSNWLTTEKSVVARRRPALRSAATLAPGTSGMYERPASIALVLRESEIDADRVEPALGELHRKRKTDVAEADYSGACCSRPNLLFKH